MPCYLRRSWCASKSGCSIDGKAQQGARANDHGCHVSCSEQHEPRQPRSWLILNVRRKTARITVMSSQKKMRSFQLYLPGGKVPTKAGLAVVGFAVASMVVVFVKMDAVARMLPDVSLGQLKALSVALGLVVIGIGWAVLKIFGVPFSKSESA